MRALLKKNLIAHKATNKLTSIIYALTLGCIIFLCVSLNLMLKSVSSAGVMQGSDITVHADMDETDLLASMVDGTLRQYEDKIKSWSYVTQSVWQLSEQVGDDTDTHTSYHHTDTAKQRRVWSQVNGVSPSANLDS